MALGECGPYCNVSGSPSLSRATLPCLITISGERFHWQGRGLRLSFICRFWVLFSHCEWPVLIIPCSRLSFMFYLLDLYFLFYCVGLALVQLVWRVPYWIDIFVCLFSMLCIFSFIFVIVVGILSFTCVLPLSYLALCGCMEFSSMLRVATSLSMFNNDELEGISESTLRVATSLSLSRKVVELPNSFYLSLFLCYHYICILMTMHSSSVGKNFTCFLFRWVLNLG